MSLLSTLLNLCPKEFVFSGENVQSTDTLVDLIKCLQSVFLGQKGPLHNPQGRVSKHLNQDVITGISIATELCKNPLQRELLTRCLQLQIPVIP